MYSLSYLSLHRYRLSKKAPLSAGRRFTFSIGDYFVNTFLRIYYWEFWPWPVLYIPIYVPILCRFIFHRLGVNFIAATNPSLPFGGFLGDRKSQIDKVLPEQYTPKTLLVSSDDGAEEVLALMRRHELIFPIVLKPDLGRRGQGVSIIGSIAELQRYMRLPHRSLVVQPFLDYPIEIGLFYHRMPGVTTGKVSSLVLKTPLYVLGDGKRMVGELMRVYTRLRLYLFNLHARKSSLLSYVPAAGEVVFITNLGNHAQGALFSDARDCITPKLEQFINSHVANIPGFYYGRFDIKCRSLEDFLQGQHFHIIELNGSAAEIAHIFHPYTSFWRAYRETLQHLHVMFRIAIANKDQVRLSSKEKRFFLREVWRIIRNK